MNSAFIRKNNPELLTKLKELGYSICICTEFEDSVWLHIFTENKTIHGIGYFDPDYTPSSQKAILEKFLYENNTSINPSIDCLEDDEKFLKIAKELINGENKI
jgi:hypothetical protein